MMNVKRVWMAGIAGMAVSVGAWAADVTGNWAVSIETPQGTRTPSMALTQKGEEVTGTYKSQRGEVPISGTVKGNDVKLSYKIGAGDRELVINYEGTVDGDTMSGKVGMGQMGEGKFTAKKQ
jgi:hypothetical protein